MFEIVQKRKRYDKQFKLAAAQVVLSGDVKVRELSEELGVKDSVPSRFFRKFHDSLGMAIGLLSVV